MTTFLIFFLPLFLFLCPALSQAPNKISLKVNFGGGPVADFLGEDQALDMSAFSKNVARHPIQNTDQPEVFQSQRFSRGADMTFRIPVPDGIYSVTLLFAETFQPACVPGARVFDISIGTPVSGLTKVVDAFDVFQSAGCTAAHGKRFDNVSSKEGIVVHLTHRKQHPSIAGFIVEGYPQIRGDGQEYKAIARAPADPVLSGLMGDGQGPAADGGGEAEAGTNMSGGGMGVAAAPAPVEGPTATREAAQGAFSGGGAVHGMQPGMAATPRTGDGGTMGMDSKSSGAAAVAEGGGSYVQPGGESRAYGQQATYSGVQTPQVGGAMQQIGGRRRLLAQKEKEGGVLTSFMKWTSKKQTTKQEGKMGKKNPVSVEELGIGSEEEIRV